MLLSNNRSFAEAVLITWIYCLNTEAHIKCIVYFAISVQTLFKHELCVLPKFIWSTRHLEMINRH